MFLLQLVASEMEYLKKLKGYSSFCFHTNIYRINVVFNYRRQQEIEAAGLENPALMSELRALRQRKDELETHLATLQDSRRQLMVQLEGLMKMLKVLF